MHGVLRINSFDPERVAAGAALLGEFDAIHAAQPGFVGTVTVDLGGGRRFVLNLWESDEDRVRGLAALGPAVERLVNPLLREPSELIGVGPVETFNLVIRRTSG